MSEDENVYTNCDWCGKDILYAICQVNGDAGISVEYILYAPVAVREDVLIIAHRFPPL